MFLDPKYNPDLINIFEANLDEINVKDPDTLYFQIENNLQSLIDIYTIYDPDSKDLDKLNLLLTKVYELHEHCNLDVVE